MPGAEYGISRFCKGVEQVLHAGFYLHTENAVCSLSDDAVLASERFCALTHQKQKLFQSKLECRTQDLPHHLPGQPSLILQWQRFPAPSSQYGTIFPELYLQEFTEELALKTRQKLPLLKKQLFKVRTYNKRTTQRAARVGQLFLLLLF